MTSFKTLLAPRSRALGSLRIGTATAATQIESGQLPTNWHDWAATPGNVADASSPADSTDHWNRWREDNALMQDLGLQISRLGLEWARIEPEPGRFDHAVLDRYREEIGDLVDRGIEPLVTLHHFSQPRWLQEKGQFTNPATIEAYLRFTREVVQALHDLVPAWVTLNEPNVYATQAHLFREAPPGNRSMRDVREVLRTMAICHLRAYELIHEIDPNATVTFAHHMRVFAPRTSWNPLHRAFTAFDRAAFQDVVADAFGSGRFHPLLGRSPVGPGTYLDVAGLNYYSRTAVTGPTDGTFPDVPVNDLGWEVYPQGLVDCARELHERFNVPVWITENGICDNGSERLVERARSRFIADHLAAILDSDVPIERYYHWCFVDNWEWSEGMIPRFGIVHLDRETKTRTVKPSGRFLAEIIAAGALERETIIRYAGAESYRQAGDTDPVNEAPGLPASPGPSSVDTPGEVPKWRCG